MNRAAQNTCPQPPRDKAEYRNAPAAPPEGPGSLQGSSSAVRCQEADAGGTFPAGASASAAERAVQPGDDRPQSERGQ